MKLAVQTVICCFIFTMVLPLVKGATMDLNSSLKRRLRVWLQSRTRRDLHGGLVTAGERNPEVHVEPPQGPQRGGAENLMSLLSYRSNIRPRRSTVMSSKKSGCFLVTCTVHDVIYRIHQLNSKHKETNAPLEKIGSTGYGRRRRSLEKLCVTPVLKTRRPGFTQGGHGAANALTPA